MGQIHYLTYVSRITLKAGVTPRTLSDIMAVAQRENLAHQITGCLCFGNGYFFQYIEGENSAIEQLFGNIQRDGRNRDVTLKSKGVIEQRLFQDWQMLMVNTNNPETHEDVINAFLPILSTGSTAAAADKFVEVMRSQYHRRSLVDFQSYSLKNVSHYGISLRGLLKVHQHFLLVQSILLVLILISFSLFWGL
ncbi:Sensors of blue-light using FAD [Enhydrobacter sp. 8BJ]|nr:BLUF domain-containing protein [Enhydrobacter sp. 8BJ]VXB00337.1 Sensors of blue-light using FAD [Enhydrobacter sp. 8BJ]